MLVAQSTSSTTVTAGVSFSVTFLVETSQGTLYTGYDGAVMLSVLTGPAGYLPISGAGPETPSNGIVTFPAVILDTAGSYVLQATATSGNLTAGDTGAITVVAGAVASLSIVEEPPTSVGAGSDFSFVVGAEDQFGNPTALSRTVSVAISSNPGGATLGGPTAVNASGGVATFSDLTLNKVGSPYILEALERHADFRDDHRNHRDRSLGHATGLGDSAHEHADRRFPVWGS